MPPLQTPDFIAPPDDPAAAALIATGFLIRNWWAVALRGLAAVGFGLITLLLPGATLYFLVVLFGFYMIFDGVFALLSGLRAAAHHRHWGALLLEGVIGLAMGAIALLAPIVTIAAFAYLGAVWAILTGIVLFSTARRLHGGHGRFWLGAAALLSILWGIALVFAPIAGAVVMAWWLGLYALAFGGMMLVLATRLRRIQAGR